MWIIICSPFIKRKAIDSFLSFTNKITVKYGKSFKIINHLNTNINSMKALMYKW